MTAALASRLRRVDPVARLILEARVEAPGADIVQNAVSPHNWNSADSLAGLVITPDQAVQLSLGAPQVAAQTLGNAASLQLNTPFTSTPGAFWYVAGLSSWDPRYIGQKITSITAWLNPQNNGSQPNVIQTGQWKAQFFQAYINTQNQWAFAPKGDPAYMPGNTSGAAADITFTFANGPVIPAPGQGGAGNGFAPGPLVLMISGISNSGGLATNCVWGADAGVDSTGIIYFPTWAASGATLSLACGAPDTTLFINGGSNLANLAAYGGYIKIDSETILVHGTGILVPNPTQLNVSRGANWTTAAAHAINSVVQTNLGGTRVQAYQIVRNAPQLGGYLGFNAVPNPPRLTINVGQYSAATITFSANKFDLGAAQNPPTQPVQFTVRGDVPQGTTLQAQVLDDGGVTWRNISDGMYSNDPSLGGNVSARETYKLRATLTPNAANTATPVLRMLGVSVVTNTDLSDVAELTGGRWAIDPITLKGEMGEFTLRAVRDGMRDYQDAITQLIGNNNLVNILLRVWWGWYDNPSTLFASPATRAQWLHVDDFVIDDTNPLSATLELTLLSPLSLVKQALPRYDPVLRQRLALTYPNASVPTATLDAVDKDLVLNQLGSQLPTRFVGPRLPQATVPVPILTGGSIVSNTAANPSVITCANAHNKTGTFPVLISGSTDPAINSAFTATVIDATHFSVPVLGAGGTGGTWSSAPGTAVAIKVAKTIVSTDTNPAPGRPAVADDAKTELDALAFLAGFANISSQGRLKVVDCFGTQAVKVQFALEELAPQSVLPGFRHRLPEFWVPWGWNGSGYPFLSYALNAAALLALGQATIEPRPLDDTVAQWITAQTGDIAAVSSLADAISTRMVNSFGPGLILWSFRTDYRYPELEPGDLVAVPTDWFVAHDPIAGRALKGLLYGLGVIQACDTSGREFAVWIRSYADIVGFAQGAGGRPDGLVGPAILSAAPYARANHVIANWQGNSLVQSVKVAGSNSGYPAAGTGTVVSTQNGVLDLGAFVYADHAYVTITPYSGTGATGIQGVAWQGQVQVVQIDTMFDFATGKPVRSSVYTDGLFATQAADSAGQQVTRAVQIAGQVRTLAQMLTELVPNAEFDIWESASQPHAWAVDTTAGATCAQDNSVGNVYSGDWALKYSNPDNASNSGWHGVNTNDLNKGAFCIPLRGGLTYRIKIATKCSKVSAGEKYRIVVSYNAAETLQSILTNTYAAVGVWQVDTYLITVPANADPNSKLYVQANRNADAAATDFWFDSLRLVEDTPSAADLAMAAAGAGTNIVQNPGFESGVAYWRQTSGGSLDSETATPIAGAKDGIVLSVASTTHRVQQCDRASDLSGGQNPSGGNPLYIPVNGSDEIYGSIAFKCNTGAAGTWQFGVEEYDINKSLIQRTYLGSAATINGTLTPRGGVTLQATTAFVVPIIEVIASVGGGGITHHFDSVAMFRVSPPKLRVKAGISAVVSLVTATPTTVQWNNNPDEFDVGAMHDPTGVAQSNTRIIAPAAAVGYGAIHVHAQVQFASNAVGLRQVIIKKNGATIIAEAEATAVNGAVTTIDCSAIEHHPASGDYYEVIVQQTSGGNLNLVNGFTSSFFEAHQIV